MSAPAFAKLPSEWVRRELLSPQPLGTSKLVKGRDATEPVLLKRNMGRLEWRQHKSGATAALLILFALSIISNRAQRRDGLRRDEKVTATYEHIQEMVPLSRKLIADGIQLLVMVEAISVDRDGRKNVYTLSGIETPGNWCQLPQQHIQNGCRHLQRLQFFVDQIRRKTSLHALKLYMLLLTFRDRHTNFAAISYEKVSEYTGMRREEIRVAIQLLISSSLCRQLKKEEAENAGEERSHNRYMICGLAST